MTFVPTDITGCLLWLDFADADTLFIDAGTTKVSADAQAIYQANDKSGNNFHATQSTLAQRPLYKTGIQNSKSIALFDGTDDNFAISLSALAGSYTIFAVYNNNEALNGSINAGGYLMDSQTGRLIIAAVSGDAASYKHMAWYDGSWHNIADAINGWQTNTWHLVSGGNGTIYRNGASLGAAAYTEKAIGGGVRIGSKYLADLSYAKISFGEYIIYNKSLTAGEIASVEIYLNNKWAIYDAGDDLTALDLTLNSLTFDAPTLVNVAGTTNLTAADFTLSPITFDAPTLEIIWNTPACRTYSIAAESRSYAIEAESRGLKILCGSATAYTVTGLNYNGLTGKDLTLAQPTFDVPILTTNVYVPGVWSWFTKPTFVYYDNNKYFTLIDTQATDLKIYKTNSATGELSSYTLNANFGTDDHNLGSILVRSSDSKILVFSCVHNDATINLQISTNAEDISTWGDVISLDASLGSIYYDYPCPIQLTEETNDPIYLFYRNNVSSNSFSKSEDGGETWASGTKFFQYIDESSVEHRPYFQIVRNGTNRIDFTCTQGHPNEVTGCSIYHFYYTGGKYYKSDGTEITGALPLKPADVTQVYDGSTVESWVWDIAIDGSGNPIIVFATFPTPASDHRYNYARWTGSAWDIHQICTAGQPLYSPEIFYSGGVTLDKGDPNIVWCSRNVTGQWEIYKYVTADGGATWAETQITTGSSGVNIRPTCADGATGLYPLWCEGRYTTYADTDCQVKFTN